MSPRIPNNITRLTGDYDAIELALRETTRGRWFLSTYLERNRSTETRMLLDAIAKLELAMRENGHVADSLAPMETLAQMRDGIMVARQDIATARRREGSPEWLPLPRFSFESLPDAMSDETRAIRAAAANLEMAAQALRTAGVFHGVAQQISDRVCDIQEACEAQEAAMLGTRRMAQLVAELESEILGALDERGESTEADAAEAPRDMHTIAEMDGRSEILAIRSEVLAELSAALDDTLTDEGLCAEPVR
jgi:chemotaxis protein CheZ